MKLKLNNKPPKAERTSTMNRKQIGTLCMLLGVFAGVVGMGLSMVIFPELARSGTFLDGNNQLYNIAIISYGLVMIFFFVMLFLAGVLFSNLKRRTILFGFLLLSVLAYQPSFGRKMADAARSRKTPSLTSKILTDESAPSDKLDQRFKGSSELPVDPSILPHSTFDPCKGVGLSLGPLKPLVDKCFRILWAANYMRWKPGDLTSWWWWTFGLMVEIAVASTIIVILLVLIYT